MSQHLPTHKAGKPMRQLTESEIRFFKTNGYLVLRDVLDKALCAQACERLWDAPPPSFKKDDPDTWTGPIKEEEFVGLNFPFCLGTPKK